MTKTELTLRLAQKMEISRAKAEAVVATIFENMKAALDKNNRIELRGFGSFSMREYEAYKGRNPRTGEFIEIPKKRLPFFKVGKELRRDLNKKK